MNWKTIELARRRLGNEQGAILKDWGGRIHIALVYPNSYTLGMSNLGFQTIYGFFNKYNQVACERAFYEGHETISLETQRPLTDFDILAFSFSFEPDYFSAINVLKSSGIPVFTAERIEQHPLIIAGGAAVTANPEPLADIIDCFAIGEGEAVLPQMVEVLLAGAEYPRHQLLRELGKLPGVYVPCASSGPVVRQWARNIDDFPTASVVLTPDTELGDMYLLEIARGCPWGCRFCLAGFHFRPMRSRSLGSLLSQASVGMQYGKRIGLVGAAVSSHPQIDELVAGLRGMGAAFSVSSLRINPLSDVVLNGLAESGTKTVSLAPEAGSQRLRQVVNKGISEDDILKAMDEVAGYGFRQIKLYFMIGLPAETDEDIVDIASLALAAKGIMNRHKSGAQLILNISPFVPKAGTPFQWLPMEKADVLKKRLALLKRSLGRKGIEVKADSIEWSLVQGMLSRGDSRMGQVIASMHRVSLPAWRKSLDRAGLDAESIHREVSVGEQLPWSMIDSGVKTEYLRAEMERAYNI